MPTKDDVLKASDGSSLTPRKLKELEASMNDESLSPDERKAAHDAYESAVKRLNGLHLERLDEAVKAVTERLLAMQQETLQDMTPSWPKTRPFSHPFVEREADAWDYCHIWLMEGTGGYVVQGVSPNLEHDARIIQGTSIDDVLAILGNDSWELITTLGIADKPHFVFKRLREGRLGDDE